MEDLFVNTQTLYDMARERRAETLRAAGERRRARLALPHHTTLRSRLGAGITALGEKLQALGAALTERTE